MADSNRLHNVAAGNGWKERIEHFLLKKAMAVLLEATPDATELALAKLLLYPTVTAPTATTASPSPSAVARHFGQALVTVSAVSSALSGANFDHTAFSDANFETQVNLLWTDYAKSTV